MGAEPLGDKTPPLGFRRVQAFEGERRNEGLHDSDGGVSYRVEVALWFDTSILLTTC